MYSKRRSRRAPGSIHAPSTFQFVFTMQNAEPHDAAASPAMPAKSAAMSRSFFMRSSRCDETARHGWAVTRQRVLALRKTLGGRERSGEKTPAADRAQAARVAAGRA